MVLRFGRKQGSLTILTDERNMPMRRKNFVETVLVVLIMFLICSVVAQEKPPQGRGATNVSAQNVPTQSARPGSTNKHTTPRVQSGDNASTTTKQGSVATQVGKPTKNFLANQIGDQRERLSTAQFIIITNSITQSECRISERIGTMSKGIGDKIDDQRNNSGAVAPDKYQTLKFVLAWIAAVATSIAVVAICLVFPLLFRLRWLNKDIGDRVQQNGVAAKDISMKIDGIKSTVADLPKALQLQLKLITDVVQKVDGRIGKFERTASDIPRQFDAVAKAMSRDAESHRGSILSWLFGRGKTQAPENGFTQQIEDRIEKFQSAVLSAVESDQKLQSRKLELEERERRLNERATAMNAECARARDEGAAAAERRVAALETANRVLSENMSAKSIEFGKQVATLEGERNAATAAAQQAKSECVVARSQADAAVKLREKLSDEVKRLSSEITKRDQAKEAEIASACEEIRSKIENANAAEMASLRVEAANARDERDRAKKAAEELQAMKVTVDAELATTKSLLDAEKVARENDITAAARELSAEKLAREEDRQKAEKKLAEVATERDKAISRVFPAEIREDSDCQPLLQDLDEWDSRGIPGSALARASLAIFADRRNQPPKIWQRALGDFSLGLASAMNADKKSPVEVAEMLGKWKAVLERRSVGGPAFSLKLPSIGSQVDTSWMHAKPGAAKVSRIGSWAVYGQSGNVYMAEVE